MSTRDSITPDNARVLDKRPARKAWDPAAFKDELLRHMNAHFDVLKMGARGEIESSLYQDATHRLSEEDVTKITVLGEQVARVILQAKVQRATKLVVVKV